LLRDKQRRSRARRCRDMCDSAEPASVLVLEHVDITFATTHVQPLARRVEEEIIGIADDVERPGTLPVVVS